MSDANLWQLVPDSECDDQDEYPDDDQIRHDIAGWTKKHADWEQGEGVRQVTIMDSDGRRVGPDMMTHTQMEAYSLIEALLEWAGREAATASEMDEVNGLRERAKTLLKEMGVRAA